MFTRTGEYALQAIVCIVNDSDGAPISGPKIASLTDIPQKYLSAVLASLVRFGVLEASPGRGGGFSLARPAGDICLEEILRPFEAVLADRRPCPFGKPMCSDTDPCVGHDRWKLVRESFYEFVNGTTVLDLSLERQAKKRSGTSTGKRKSPKGGKRTGRAAR
ncbi:MAG: RrF2 family transcriptional regulator [Planctomycetota bacterium]